MSKSLDLTSVETRLAALDAEEMAGHVSRAFTVARAIREEIKEARADAPDLDWLKSFLPRLTDRTAVLISSESVAEAVDEWHDHGDDTMATGAVLLFDDLSYLHFTGEEVLHEHEGQITWFTAELDTAFPNYEFMEVLGATPPFLARHPDLAAWKAGLPDDVEEDITSAIAEAIRDEIDPPSDSVDMSPCQSWDAEEETRIEEIVTEAWLGLGIDEPCEVSIMSGLDDDEEITIEIECHLERHDARVVHDRLKSILAKVVGLTGFVGHSWEYNDGASDRLSGYSQYPETVASICFEPGADFSNHILIEARPKLIARLVAAGVDKAEAETLARLDLEPA